MGQIVKFKLKTKEDKEIEKLNKELQTLGLQNSFNTRQMLKDWVKDINTNPDSPQAHLKPITEKKLKEIFPYYTEIGLMTIDVAFSRTSEDEMKKYFEFVEKHVDDLKYIKDGNDILERYEYSQKQFDLIKKISKSPDEPEMLPKDEQIKPNLQSGLYLAKSWANEPFWIIFGNVDLPKFVKTKIYKDDLYNNLYKDKKGYAYMMFPLMAVTGLKETREFLGNVFERAWSLGLREDFMFIMPFIYNLKITNVWEVSNQFKEFYTEDELKERFDLIYKHIWDKHNSATPQPFRWDYKKKEFVTRNKIIEYELSLLNVLVKSLDIDYINGKVAYHFQKEYEKNKKQYEDNY